MNGDRDWRCLRSGLNLLFWLGATFVVALLPVYVEVNNALFTTDHFDASQAFQIVTVLYIILAVSASTLPAALNWALADRMPTRSTFVAAALGILLIFGMTLLAAAIGNAATSDQLIRDIKLPSTSGISMLVMLGSSILVCTVINVAATVTNCR